MNDGRKRESGNQRVLPMANSSGKAGIRGGIVRNRKYLVSSQILTSITKRHLRILPSGSTSYQKGNMQDYSFRVLEGSSSLLMKQHRSFMPVKSVSFKVRLLPPPFLQQRFRGGVLKQYLIDEDYTAPLKVEIALNVYTILSIQ